MLLFTRPFSVLGCRPADGDEVGLDYNSGIIAQKVEDNVP